MLLLTLNHEVADDPVEDAALVAAVVAVEGGAIGGQADEVVDGARRHVTEHAYLDGARRPIADVDVKVDLLGDALRAARLETAASDGNGGAILRECESSARPRAKCFRTVFFRCNSQNTRRCQQVQRQVFA